MTEITMKNGGLAPSNFTEAVKFCEIIAKSDLVSSFKVKFLDKFIRILF